MEDRKIILLILFCFFSLRSTAKTTEPTTLLPHTLLSIGTSQLDVAVATDQASREQGLMKQKILGTNEGMLFVFPSPQRVAFWMKDTALPLSIAYLNAMGRILEIHDLKPFDEHSLLSSSTAIVYVIESPRGWFSEHQILPGDIVKGLPSFSSAK